MVRPKKTNYVNVVVLSTKLASRYDIIVVGVIKNDNMKIEAVNVVGKIGANLKLTSIRSRIREIEAVYKIDNLIVDIEHLLPNSTYRPKKLSLAEEDRIATKYVEAEAQDLIKAKKEQIPRNQIRVDDTRQTSVRYTFELGKTRNITYAIAFALDCVANDTGNTQIEITSVWI